MSAPDKNWPPLILAVAPNGARKTHADHPALPITPQEIAETGAACLEAGAAMIHLHVRDKEGGHTLDAEAYRAAIAALRQAVGDRLMIQVTSEAVGIYSAEQQMAMVRELKPEAVSLAIKEIIPDEAAEAEGARFLSWLTRESIFPQYILYSAEEVRRFDDLVRRGVVPGERLFVLFVLGRYTKNQESLPADLLPFLEANTAGHPWSLCAFGRREAACAAAAAALGGHARVGFENNLLLSDGRTAPDNAASVSSAATLARAMGRSLADADTARALFAA